MFGHKNNETLSFVGTWIKLQIIMLNKTSHTKRVNITWSCSFLEAKNVDSIGVKIRIEDTGDEEIYQEEGLREVR